MIPEAALFLTSELMFQTALRVQEVLKTHTVPRPEAQILYLRFNSAPRKDQQRLRPDNTRHEELSAQEAAHHITPTGWLIFQVLSLWLRSRCHRVLNPAQQDPSMRNRETVKPFWTQMERHGRTR